MPVTYRENSSAVKWNLFVYYHPSPLYHYLAGVFNPWQRGGRAEYRDERCSSSVRDGGSGSCHDYPSLLRSPSISRRIFHFFTRDAVPFVISFLDFTIFSVKDFESFENCPVIWNGSKLCNEWIFTAVEYVFMKELIVSWYPEERQREENDDVKWDKGLV